MTFWQCLWRVQLAGLISLAAFSAFLAVLFVIEGLVVSPRETDVVGVLFLVFVLAVFYGILPVIFLGAPVYAAMTSRGKLHWLLLIVTALVPGIAMLFYHRGLGLIGLVAGPSVLLVTHKIYQRWRTGGRSHAA